MKILHLPTNIAGNAYGLAQGERYLGLNVETLSIGTNKLNFPIDVNIPYSKYMALKLIKTFIKIRNQYDVFHFNFGTSLINIKDFHLLDLPFYPRNKKLIVTYQGCDARQKYITMKRTSISSKFSACQFEKCYDGVCNSGKKDKLRKKNIDKMMRYCDHAFVVNPDLLHFLPKEKTSFLPYTIPNFDLIECQKKIFCSNDKIRIIHAPTHRVTKGSIYIIDAIKQLEQKYPHQIEFVIVENTPYQEALKLYQQADLVIDQILIGWYGGLAVEVMKMGIPVAAYINEDDLEFIPSEMAKDLPIINLDPNNIVSVLEYIIKNRECLPELSKRSIDYVNKWHDPKYVANITKKIYIN